MLGEEFTLDIRPTFIDELDRAVEYIERVFQNYQAADQLVTDVYAAIDRRLSAPLAFEPCYRPPDVAQPYYRIYVRNFTVYYVVIGNVMEVRWFRYSRNQQPLA
ncbi:MAG: type II toxin-antitoxin system RelE/ParE family toxin [Kiritimatiellae bacterium]|jgi:hypothetical protein|nr:type II toxin-antitoxin system RelE/ParE family toxin [Kiritimatiellia bacterium]